MKPIERQNSDDDTRTRILVDKGNVKKRAVNSDTRTSEWRG